MSFTRESVLKSMRRAGNVLRYHTWPTIHKQTVADHTWNVMRIYVELFGPPDRHVWMHMLYHDALEVHTGDIPFYAKRRFPELKSVLTGIEEDLSLMSDFPRFELTSNEIDECKLCDLLEMWEWGKEEVLMGNRLAHTIQADTWWAASEISERLGITELVNKWMEEKQL